MLQTRRDPNKTIVQTPPSQKLTCMWDRYQAQQEEHNIIATSLLLLSTNEDKEQEPLQITMKSAEAIGKTILHQHQPLNDSINNSFALCSKKRKHPSSLLHTSPLQTLKESFAHRGSSQSPSTSSILIRPKPTTAYCTFRPRMIPVICYQGGDDDDDVSTTDDETDESDTEGCGSPPKRRRRCIRFGPKTVHTIPSHRSYSKQEKSLIWTSPSIIKSQARRNRIEAMWEEGCGSVALEDDFVNVDGVLKHPAHVKKQAPPKASAVPLQEVPLNQQATVAVVIEEEE